MIRGRAAAAGLVLVLAGFPGAAHAAVQFVQSTPLTQVVNTPVGSVAPGAINVPVITWGGDIATIHANGNAAVTKPGPFGKLGLNLKLFREDVFAKQVDAYLSGRSPYLRGTLGMINMAAEVTSKDARTKPVIIYQLTWSAGGDALVVKGVIKTVKDLKGKTIALQAYGPHVDYLAKILADAGLSTKDVNLKWVSELTGNKNSPGAALRETGIDAALVIIPDAMALSSNGTVGTGAEDSVKGARILLSTKTANRIIADVYAVRADYLKSNRDDVEKFVRGLLQAEESLRQLVANKSSRAQEYKPAITAAAQLLLDSDKAVGDTEGMYADCEFARLGGNAAFFTKPDNPRSLAQLNREIQSSFVALGLMAKAVPIDYAKWDYGRFAGVDTKPQETARFNTSEVAGIVAKRQSQGTLGEGELFSFEVFFKPNQDKFPAELYNEAFKRVVNLASTYGGAVITVEGHSDPMAYLKAKKEGAQQVVLGRTQQSAKNLSLSRAVAVRDSVVAFAKGQGVSLDASQFAVIGHGIGQPKSGVCGGEPCAPASEKEWLNNMRVEFRIIQIEAEASAFKPL